MAADDISRREALTLSAAAGLAALLPLASGDFADAATSPVRSPLTLFSRHLHWTSMEEAVEVAADAGFGGIAWTIRPGAHVLPQNVARDLPRAVELTRRAGLGTPLIVTGLADADSPYAESILEVATGLGIRLYRAQTNHYDFTADLPAQLEAMRPRVARLAKLNERYKATALFHTHSGEVGGAVWDLWQLLRDFDPERVAINYDTGYGAMATGTGWRESIHYARRHIRTLSLKDYRWQRQATTAARRPQWSAEICPPGEGLVDFAAMCGYFHSTNFHGAAEVQFEYPVVVKGRPGPVNLMAADGSGDVGRWKLEMPRADFIALLKRDRAFYADVLRQTGLTPESGNERNV